MATADVGLLSVLNSGAVALRYEGHTYSETDGLWALAKLRKPSVCVVSDEELPVGSRAFRPVGDQDYRMKRVSRNVVWAMIAMAVESGAIGADFEGASDVMEWWAQSDGV